MDQRRKPRSFGRAYTKGWELSTWQLEECSFNIVFLELFPTFSLKQKLHHADTHSDTQTSSAVTGVSAYLLVLLGAGKEAVNCVSWSSSVLWTLWTVIPLFFLSPSLPNFCHLLQQYCSPILLPLRRASFLHFYSQSQSLWTVGPKSPIRLIPALVPHW